MKFKVTLILFALMLSFSSCKESNVAGIIIENNSPAVNKEGELIESIGIETLGGVLSPLIQSGSKQPISITKVFSTAVDNQSQIMIKLYRGNSEMVKEATFLGRYKVSGIPSLPRGVPKIEMTFSVNDHKILLFGKELNTNKEVAINKK